MFVNVEVFVRWSGLTVRFTDDEHVELLGEPRENGTERRSCIRKENHFQLILQHAAYYQIKGFDFAYNYKTTFDFLYI